jgi:collagen type III alpha
VVEKNGSFYCWVSSASGPEKRPVVLGMSDNARIEIKDGVADGALVLLNPRATVEEAREEEHDAGKVDVKQKFGDDKPAALSGPSRGGPGGLEGGKARAGGRPSLDMKSLDKDGDGKLSREEAPERMKDFFDNMDTDKDGAVSSAELAEVRKKMQQMQAQQGGMPGGGPGGPGGAPGGGGPGGGGPGGGGR